MTTVALFESWTNTSITVTRKQLTVYQNISSVCILIIMLYHIYVFIDIWQFPNHVIINETNFLLPWAYVILVDVWLFGFHAPRHF